MSSLLTTGMANQPRLIRNGLALYLDVANRTSYPGSGNTWYDLSGNGRHMTLNNSPTYSTNNGGILQFNSSNQANQNGVMNNMDYRYTSFTLMCATRYAGSLRGRIVNGLRSNNIYGNHSACSDRYYAGGWVYQGSTTNDLNWNIHAFTENYPSDLRSYYRNDIPLAVNSTLGTIGFNGLSVARFAQSTGEYSNCEISFIIVYDRVLNTNELTYNFNYFKTRFGL